MIFQTLLFPITRRQTFTDSTPDLPPVPAEFRLIEVHGEYHFGLVFVYGCTRCQWSTTKFDASLGQIPEDVLASASEHAQIEHWRGEAA